MASIQTYGGCLVITNQPLKPQPQPHHSSPLQSVMETGNGNQVVKVQTLFETQTDVMFRCQGGFWKKLINSGQSKQSNTSNNSNNLNNSVTTPLIHRLGLTQWNLNSFEFKFDDTRLSS